MVCDCSKAPSPVGLEMFLCWPEAALFSMRIICSLSVRATRFSQPDCAFFSLFKILRCSTVLTVKLIDTGASQLEHESGVGRPLQAGDR
jgi:hypothetical protein